MSAAAKNFAAISAAIDDHDLGCDQAIVAVQMHPHDIARMGWSEGDVIRGAHLEASDRVQPDRFTLICEGDPTGEIAGAGDVVQGDRVLA